MRRLLALFVLLACVPAHAVKMSALTGEYSLADASYGLALDGSSDDGPEAVAALAAIGTYKTIIIPAGKTLVTCRPLILPEGTQLIGYGATIKRCAQPSSITTTTDITSGSTTQITASDASGFAVGQVVNLVGATYFSKTYSVITDVTGNVITVSPAFSMYALSNDAVQASVTETLNVYRVGAVLQIDSDKIKVRGLKFDGNRTNFASPCRWEVCMEVYDRASFTEVEDAEFTEAPGEGIIQATTVTLSTDTNVTAYTTTLLTMSSSAVTAGFEVGDVVALMNINTGVHANEVAYDEQAHRIQTIGGVGDVDITLATPTNLLPPALRTTGLITTQNGLTLYRLNQSNKYQRNKFFGLDGNGVHLSGSYGAYIGYNEFRDTNADSAVGHSWGAISYSCQIYDSRIVGNTIWMENSNGIKSDGCAIIDVFINDNNFYIDDDSTANTLYAIEFYAYQPNYTHRVTISDNSVYGPNPSNNNMVGYGIRISGNASALTAETDQVGPSRLTIANNKFKNSGIYLYDVSRILVEGNMFDATNSSTLTPITLRTAAYTHIKGNECWRGYACIRVLDFAGSVGLSLTGNKAISQSNYGIRLQNATQDVVVADNDIVAPNITFTNALYVGIEGVPIGSQIVDNRLQIDKGDACIVQNTTADYSMDGNGTVVAGNICRDPAGTVMDSIRVSAGSTSLHVTENYVWEAINDLGTTTVTTPANVVIP